ncbi:MAG: hypothetical protein JNL18_08660 [Planctomycetaceae bacterium]|uniref:Cytochrome C n=1 Tax=Lacipirellula limnantheis TaxID=2528024 RepID=A0A517TXS8_9BACT|nr:hypothetical protein [Lacipirellula limnantheis]MBL9162788.1 hypothetical protein [Planctomycetaceae bacterium]QDT73187.1 hypothetical protein I41_23760 [Lacipirellula limnantheis]
MKLALVSLMMLWAPLAVAADQQEHSPAEPTKSSKWMDVKVEESQKVFAALARADFPAIVASTEKLKNVSKVEGLVRRTAPGYRTQLRSFEFAVEEIQQQAQAENIEGVTMGFNQLTLSCVNCHRQLRRAAATPSGKTGVDHGTGDAE